MSQIGFPPPPSSGQINKLVEKHNINLDETKISNLH